MKKLSMALVGLMFLLALGAPQIATAAPAEPDPTAPAVLAMPPAQQPTVWSGHDVVCLAIMAGTTWWDPKQSAFWVPEHNATINFTFPSWMQKVGAGPNVGKDQYAELFRRALVESGFVQDRTFLTKWVAPAGFSCLGWKPPTSGGPPGAPAQNPVIVPGAGLDPAAELGHAAQPVPQPAPQGQPQTGLPPALGPWGEPDVTGGPGIPVPPAEQPETPRSPNWTGPDQPVVWILIAVGLVLLLGFPTLGLAFARR